MEPAAFAVGSASTLDAEAAIKVYLAKASCSPRDGTTAALAKQYNITMKAVRDVWNLRTWTWSTMPYWTYSDQKKFLRQHLCIHCRIKGVTSLASACKTCATPRRRGRRPVQTPGRELLSSDAAESTLTEAFANDLPNMTPPQDYAQEDAGLPRNLLRMLPHAAHVYVSHCDAANIPPGRGQLLQKQGVMRSSRQQFAFEDYEARSFSMQPSAAYFCSTIGSTADLFSVCNTPPPTAQEQEPTNLLTPTRRQAYAPAGDSDAAVRHGQVQRASRELRGSRVQRPSWFDPFTAADEADSEMTEMMTMTGYTDCDLSYLNVFS